MGKLKVVSREDEASSSRNSPGRSLARIKKAILNRVGVDDTRLKTMVSTYIARTQRGRSVDKRHSQKTNVMRAFLGTKITWTKLFELFRVLEFRKIEITFKITDRRGREFEVTETVEYINNKRLVELETPEKVLTHQEILELEEEEDE